MSPSATSPHLDTAYEESHGNVCPYVATKFVHSCCAAASAATAAAAVWIFQGPRPELSYFRFGNKQQRDSPTTTHSPVQVKNVWPLEGHFQADRESLRGRRPDLVHNTRKQAVQGSETSRQAEKTS